MNKPELLCPAGDLERLQMALHFGADAVYLAGAQFGMRAGAENFTLDGIRAADPGIVAVDLFMREPTRRVRDFAVSKIRLLGAGA